MRYLCAYKWNGLVLSTRLMLDASFKGLLLGKSYKECYDLVEFITANSYRWLSMVKKWKEEDEENKK